MPLPLEVPPHNFTMNGSEPQSWLTWCQVALRWHSENLGFLGIVFISIPGPWETLFNSRATSYTHTNGGEEGIQVGHPTPGTGHVAKIRSRTARSKIKNRNWTMPLWYTVPMPVEPHGSGVRRSYKWPLQSFICTPNRIFRTSLGEWQALYNIVAPCL